MKIWIPVGAVMLVLATGATLWSLGYFYQPAAPTAAPTCLSNAQIAQKMLPDLSKDLDIHANHDLVIEDVHVVPGSRNELEGVARNNTARPIQKAELTFEITDGMGSRQGAVTGELKNIAANSATPFRFSLSQQSAAFAMVRDVRID